MWLFFYTCHDVENTQRYGDSMPEGLERKENEKRVPAGGTTKKGGAIKASPLNAGK